MEYNLNSLAPIALFTYNRPDHTRQTVTALQNNYLAEQSELIIFSDAPKSSDAISAVNQVRQYLHTIQGFKSIQIIEQQENYGLAKSIIKGVTQIVNEYGRIIVLEDDLVTSPAFLTYMNQALDYYENNRTVWHISGWNYPINRTDLDGAFLWRVMTCWGWATWADRWQHFDKNPNNLIQSFNNSQIKQFDLDHSGIFWSQVIANKNGTIDTWAIFWYATIFRYHGLCLNPTLSYVDNIGLDGSGEHCGLDNTYSIDSLNTDEALRLPNDIVENQQVVQLIKAYYRGKKVSILKRVVNKLLRYTK